MDPMIFYSLVLPGLVAMGIPFLCKFALAGAKLPPLTLLVIMAALILVTIWGLKGWPDLPPKDSTEVFFFAVGILPLVAWLAPLIKDPPGKAVLDAMFLLMALHFILKPLVEDSWSLPDAFLIIVGTTTAIIGWKHLYLRVKKRFKPGEDAATLSLGVTVGMLALLLLFANSAFYAQVAGSVGFALLLTFLMGEPTGETHLTLLTLSLGLLCTMGYFYAELNLNFLAAVVASPLVSCLLLKGKRLTTKPSYVFAAGVSLIPGILGVAYAWISYVEQSSYY